MLPRDAQLVSVNDHLVEPAGLWADRRRPASIHAIPYVERTSEGEFWRIGSYTLPVADMAVLGSGTDQRSRATRYVDMHPAVSDPSARIAAMDLDGVEVHTLWPNLIGFAGERLRYLGATDLWVDAVRTYNDFLLSEFCPHAPTRLVGVGLVPFCDGRRAAEEASRVATMGARAVAFPHSLQACGLPTLYTGEWTQLFSVLEEAGLPLVIHIGRGVGSPEGASFGSFGALLTDMNFDVLYSVVDLVFSQVLLQHRRLQVAFVEGGAAWLPYVGERMDFFLKRDGVWDQLPGMPRPSELLARRASATFLDDPNAIRWREQIGVERLLWQSDFPHGDGFWPHSRRHLETALADIPDDQARRIAEENARAFLHLPRAGADGAGSATPTTSKQ
jgi:predicted TIM-barrel fold metal-dependent hydrolase